MKTIKNYLYIALSGLLMTSCLDTVVLPDDKTVGEDYWKDRDDVSAMVASAYNAMLSEAFIERCIVWGDFRSDDLNHLSGTINVAKETDLMEMNTGNMDNTNTYGDWASFYSAINICNIVLERAPSVVAIDPNYTESTLRTDRSQMLALRALCHFYLVRAFRDIPYVTTASFNSSQDFQVHQVSPLKAIDSCIVDLKAALETPLSAQAYNDWRRVGLVNRDAINAMLADVYLWRASMTGSASDYEQCVSYCDAVIDSKISQAEGETMGGFGMNMTSTSDYPLYDAESAYNQIFSRSGNAQLESIFELQMDGQNASNAGLRNMYFNYDTDLRTHGLVRASSVFHTVGSDGGVFTTENDYRYHESCKNIEEDLAEYDVLKMVATEVSRNGTAFVVRENLSGTSRISRNWIVYRLTDVMLMKAEALVQLATTESDTRLTEAFELVKAVNDRALADDTPESEKLVSTSYASKADMETLVLQERQRELCFEGKRWFDLLRYNFRHVDGLQPDKTMAEISDNASAFPSNYAQFNTLVSRKYTSGGSAVMAKMQTEPYLYFPIITDEITANPNLRQNPAYNTADIYQRQ